MRQNLFSSTRKKITIISTAIVFSCLIIFAIITGFLYSSRVLDNVDMQINQLTTLIKEESYENGFDSVNEALKREPPFNFKFKYDERPIKVPPNLIVIVYKDNELDNISKNLYFSSASLPDIPDDSIDNLIIIQKDEYTFRATTINVDNYKIEVLSNIDSEVHSIKRLRNSIFISFIILMTICCVLSRFLASRVLKPVKEAYDKQVFFVQDASHEMRTPLAVIKGKLELLAHSFGDTIDMHFDLISKMMTEIRSLEKLNSDLLLLSKEDINSSKQISEINLNKFIDDISDFYTDIAEVKNKKFKVTKPLNKINVKWDFDKIKRIVVILLENAFKYTDDSGIINLKFEEFNKYIQITVKDNGIGISEKDKERIFDRFYRSEKVRAESISGNGIGLSLLKSISKDFGIKIKVNSTLNKGTEFILNVPKEVK
ncbi:HAMP domain-containing sensor histidine kinase [Clostridium sp. BJN0001]|uniref:sensor histidine kinase n=1 Tax=Clostridium sp. BJN0001 TaxID=2930219 RepID=UPI001FD0BC3D|nr:HAMP domain-containing sensor histidine kinase [Clostridium sp. BJN0001]